MEQSEGKGFKETDVTVSVNTDGREAFEFTSKYPKEIRKEIRNESIYLFFIMFLSLAVLFLNWSGLLSRFIILDESSNILLKYFITFAFSGMLGGILFGMKYFYRVVARGYWHQDRKYWRIMSPFISLIVALIIGAMSSSGLLTTQEDPRLGWQLSIGFFAGYFADEAVGKMYEIASVVFGKSTKGDRDGDRK